MQRGLLSEVDASNSVLRSLFDSCEEQGTGGRLSLQVSSREAHPKKLTATHEGVIIDARRKMAFAGHTASLAFMHAPATVHRPPHARQLLPPAPRGLSRSMQGEAAAAEARHHEVQACQEGRAH